MNAPISRILAIADPTEFAIAINDHVASFADPDDVSDLSEAERTVFCIDGVEREVNNGGFSQFYFNEAGNHAAETVAALRRIGAAEMAALVARANAAFGRAGPAADRAARQDQLEAIEDAAEAEWNALDQQFYQYPDDLPTLLRAYVRQHAASIRAA